MEWKQSKPKTGGSPYWHHRGRYYFSTVKRVSSGFRWQVEDDQGSIKGKGVKNTVSQAKTACKNCIGSRGPV